ncbi:response regulator [Enemella evansiae]|nr:response regulator transcription factor [Enemella evansiae]
MTIRLLVVDDQQLLRRGLRMLLETADGLQVVGEAADGREALAVLPRCRPDVVLTDARMPGMDGLELVAALAERHPGLSALVLTTFDDEAVVLGSLGAGAAGFLLKDVSTDRLAEAIREVATGGVVIDPRIARIALSGGESADRNDPLAVLTRTERLVAERVARGLTNAEIAAELVLAEGTVKNHVSSLLRKLDQRDRTALALVLHRAFNG